MKRSNQIIPLGLLPLLLLAGASCGDVWETLEDRPATRRPPVERPTVNDEDRDAGVDLGGPFTGNDPTQAPRALLVELQGNPEVNWNRATGRTDVVAQFIIRDQEGIPVDPALVSVDLLVDGEPVDVEGLFSEDAQELASSLHYALVLDASYSMTQHDPPAFAPMLAAAADTVEAATALWQSAPGDFSWRLAWFDDFVYASTGDWDALSLMEIPTPVEGSATRLYGAAQYMSDSLLSDYYDGIAAGPRDHHVMVVFSDGADNISWFDNSVEGSEFYSTTPSRAEYERRGSEPVESVELLVHRLQQHPNLTVHVIGLGSAINQDELATLAEGGGGVFLTNPDVTEIDALFARITKEFSTLQTRGATIPLRPGNYSLTVHARSLQGTATGDATFAFRAGDDDARVLSAAP